MQKLSLFSDRESFFLAKPYKKRGRYLALLGIEMADATVV
jgi:hypothetical protein